MPAWRGLTTALVRFVRPWVVPVVALGAVTLGVGLCWWWVQEWGAVGAGLACSAGYVAGMLASAAVFCHATRLPAGALVPGVADVARLIAAARGGRRRVQTALARS
jgi:hypothetical protein